MGEWEAAGNEFSEYMLARCSHSFVNAFHDLGLAARHGHSSVNALHDPGLGTRFCCMGVSSLLLLVPLPPLLQMTRARRRTLSSEAAPFPDQGRPYRLLDLLTLLAAARLIRMGMSLCVLAVSGRHYTINPSYSIPLETSKEH